MIKTWKDVEQFYNNETKENINRKNIINRYLKISDKIFATLKISKLIEYYGGWVDKNDEYWCIVPCGIHENELKIICSNEDDCYGRNFIRFKTFELAEEFMSYSENRILVEKYYMI